jgi:hypothetical protein
MTVPSLSVNAARQVFSKQHQDHLVAQLRQYAALTQGIAIASHTGRTFPIGDGRPL